MITAALRSQTNALESAKRRHTCVITAGMHTALSSCAAIVTMWNQMHKHATAWGSLNPQGLANIQAHQIIYPQARQHVKDPAAVKSESKRARAASNGHALLTAPLQEALLALVGKIP